LNVHLEPGIGFQSLAPQNRLFGAGLAASLKADYAIANWIALELVAAGMQFSTDAFAEPGRSAGFGGGVRLRLLDDNEGYAWHLGDAPGHEGNYFGNLWVDITFQAIATGPLLRAGGDFAIGVELSLIDELQVGPFVKYS